MYDEQQVMTLAYALRLANNKSDASDRNGIAMAVDAVAEAIASDTIGFLREEFIESVYTTTVTRPDNWKSGMTLVAVPSQDTEDEDDTVAIRAEDAATEPDFAAYSDN